MTGQAVIIRGDARQLPLADSSVDLIVTSPPYFALRSYQDGGEHYTGQIGSEGTPADWLDALWACTREAIRVLKPDGSMFVNLGDKYAGAANQRSRHATWIYDGHENGDWHLRRAAGWDAATPQSVEFSMRDKSLMGLPWRYAIGCIDQLGLILRAEIVWAKPNGLPESVTDRVRRSHEQWFHFTKQPRYYSAVDEIRETHSGGSHTGRTDKGFSPRNTRLAATGDHGERRSDTDPDLFNPLGKLPGSVWSIPSQPLQVPAHLGVDHFAAFPMEWPRRLILGWSPPGICTACGQGRRPATDISYSSAAKRGGNGAIARNRPLKLDARDSTDRRNSGWIQ